MGFPRAWSIAAAAAAVLAAAVSVACIEHGLVARSGLTSSPVGEDLDLRGYIIFPDPEPRRVVLQLPVGARGSLDLDGERIIDAAAVRPETRVQRGRGLHEVRFRYLGPALPRPPKLLWASGEGTPTDIPGILLVPEVVSTSEVRRRIAIAAIAPYAPFACSLLLLAALAMGGAALLGRLFKSGMGPRWAWAAVAALFAAGLSWGLPDGFGWAPDELDPAAVRDAIGVRFSGGWATLYPPVHFAVLAAVTAPFHLSLSLGVGDFTDLRFYNLMYVTGRMLSLVMALGIVAVAFGLGRELAGPRAGVLGAAMVAVALPLSYYAKLANLDVPYVFWVIVSMVFFARAMRGGGRRDFYLFTCAGVVAVCTKDQAYGFYVLPALYLIAGRFHSPGGAWPGVPPPGTLARMMAIAIGGVALLQNAVFNPAGFLEHVRILTGPGSEPFRMYPGTPAGQAALFVSSIRQIGDAMSWPLFIAALCATVSAIRSRATPILWMLLPAVSYYLTVVAVVGYHYDRFFLGMIVLLAIAAGWWLERWTGAGVSFRPWRAVLLVVAFVYALARVVGLDAMMIRDSRYFVENWVVARAGPHDRVVAFGVGTYLPRRSKVFYAMMPQDVAELEALQPDYVIVNPGYSSRRSPGSRRHEMYDTLRSGGAGYDLVLRHRTRLTWSPLNLEDRFTAPDHDQFSNLTKINPVIEVYRRRATTTPPRSSSGPPSSPPPMSR